MSRRNREILENPQVVHHKNDIPQDIIHEILTRLPVKSLLRFKAVSKLWHSTISNPTFRRRCPATSIFAMSKSNTKNFYLIDEEGGVENFRLPGWSRSEYKDSRHLAISNSCNGMLLLRHGTSIFLFNPSTRYIDRILTLDKYYDDEYLIDLGFCYDELIGDYKAVIFLTQFRTDSKSAIVATLKQKEWTALRIPKEFQSIRPGPLVNDRLHLSVTLNDSRQNDTGNYTIVYYNPIINIFEKVACPQRTQDEDAIIGTGVLDDCLCMTRRIGENLCGGDIEVLKMKEYGVAESWTTLFVIKDLYGASVEPLLLIKNGDIVLIRDLYTMSRYNLAKKTYTNLIEIGSISIPQMEMEGAVTFTENLFSPKSYRGSDGYMRNVRVCFNCGETGHMARDCSSTRRYGGCCFNCGEKGHFARECSRDVSRCYNCGRPGHFARGCRF